LRIIWDTQKEQKNIKKHHLDFSYASEVFHDSNYIFRYDEKHSIDEDRYILIGKADDEVILFVVETEIDENTSKIISARKAKKKERQEYGNGHV
jgi:uncharacterized DUF497 family protein